MTAPELSSAERATVARFYAADPAPESITERVAAAMFEAIAGVPWSQAGPLDTDGYRIEARAALDAMRPVVRRGPRRWAETLSGRVMFP